MNYKLLRFSLLSVFFMLFGGGVWAEQIALGTFDGKNGTYTEGWSTTGTGKTRTDCIIIGVGEKITSPTLDLSKYSEVTISIKARRFGQLDSNKATIAAIIGRSSVGTTDATSTSATTPLTDIVFTPTPNMTSVQIVFTCENAKNAGSTHGAGINSIEIKGKTKNKLPKNLWLFSDDHFNGELSSLLPMAKNNQGEFTYKDFVVSKQAKIFFLDVNDWSWVEEDHIWGPAEENTPLTEKPENVFNPCKCAFVINESGVYDITVSGEGATIRRTGDIKVTGYYVVGGFFDANQKKMASFFGEADKVVAANQMALNEADGTYTKTYSNVILPAGNFYYGVVATVENGADIHYVDGSDYYLGESVTAGIYNITFTFSVGSAGGPVASASYSIQKVESGFYIVGDNNDWRLDNMEPMQKVPAETQTAEYSSLDIEKNSGNFYFTVSNVPVAENWEQFNNNFRYATENARETDNGGEIDNLDVDGNAKQLTQHSGVMNIVGAAGTYRIIVGPNYDIRVETVKVEGGQEAEESTPTPVWSTVNPLSVTKETPLTLQKEAFQATIKDRLKIGDKLRINAFNIAEGTKVKFLTADGLHEIAAEWTLSASGSAPALNRAPQSRDQIEVTVTGDIWSLVSGNGVQVRPEEGGSFSTNVIEVVEDKSGDIYSEQSVWVGKNVNPVVAPCHFFNYNNFSGVTKNVGLRLTFLVPFTGNDVDEVVESVICPALFSGSPALQNRAAGGATLAKGTDYGLQKVEGGSVDIVILTDEAAGKLKDNGASIKVKNGMEVKQIELLPVSPTAINAVKDNTADGESAPFYDLSGRRVTGDYKGVVIRNGHKVVNK